MALTDIFSATTRATTIADLSLGPALAGFRTVQAKNVDIVKLAQLEAIVTAKPYSLDGLDPLDRTDTEGPWIIPLRPGFVEALAVLDESSARAAALKWADGPDWAAEGAADSDGDVVALVEALATLARDALAERASLYLWWSL